MYVYISVYIKQYDEIPEFLALSLSTGFSAEDADEHKSRGFEAAGGLGVGNVATSSAVSATYVSIE